VVEICLFKTIYLSGKAGMDHVIEHRPQQKAKLVHLEIFVF
jgi:hypothetical protein